MPKRLYIDTVGCQMNVLDSEMVVADLRKRGYELAKDLATAAPRRPASVSFQAAR